MARRIAVEIVGDSTSLERAFARSERSATKFNRDISKATRGAAAGSGIFRGFGRSVAFASGGFLAFESASAFLRSSVDAARDAAVAQRSLAAQMKASGESFKTNQERIEKTARSYARFGFQNDEVIQSLTVLERGTGNINKALGLQGLTADLARAKNIRLADAANVVAKVFGGQETALRRAVPGLAKNAHGWDLIRQAQRRLAGQAAANTTTAERFAATLHDTEEIIGTGLLPTLNRYLDRLSKWMGDTENQEKLQRIANRTANAGADAFDALAKSIGGASDAYDKYQGAVSHAPGGKHGFFQTLLGGTLKRQVDGLADSFKNLANAWQQTMGLPEPFPKGGPPRGPTTATGLLQGLVGRPGFGFVAPELSPRQRESITADAAGRRPLSLQGRFNLAELRLSQAQLTKTLADDRRILVVEKGIVEQQAAGAKSLKDKTKFTQQLVGINSQILSIDQQRTDQLKQQADLLKQQADSIKSALIDQLQAKQTRVEDTRALRDALDQQRIAKLGGGPVGIRLAGQAVADARFRLFMDKLERAPATLTKAGRFTLGNVITVNVHGVTDPDKVAKAVVAAIRRGERHGSPQSRGASTGAGAPPR